MYSSAVADHAHGAPGVFVDVVEPPRSLLGVRRDVTAFVGVAPRGPCRQPERALRQDESVSGYLASVAVQRSVAVQVSSWSDYERAFGGFEGAGRLPYAVAAYFAQGGQRARVVRIVHEYSSATNDLGCSSACLAVRRPPPVDEASIYAAVVTDALQLVDVRARNEGVWGDKLRASLRFEARPVVFTGSATTGFVTATSEWIPVGSLLRVSMADGGDALRFVADSRIESNPDRVGTVRVVEFDVALVAAADTVDVVTATLDVVDEDLRRQRTERLTGIGMAADHPRWLARVLIDESELLWPGGLWSAGRIDLHDTTLPDLVFASSDVVPLDPAALVDFHFAGGIDRSADIVPDDCFDTAWVPGDEGSADGMQCLDEHGDVGLLVVPDLYDPAPLVEIDDITDPITFAGPTFAPCVTVIPAPQRDQTAPLTGLRLDPADAVERRRIIALQQQVVAFAEVTRSMTALLDVPPGLSMRQITGWRASFDSWCAAAYHPWLDVASPDDDRDALIRVNPSAFAAGIIAAREIRDGIVGGPANRIESQAVRPAVTVTRTNHDDLHDDGINVSLLERDGVRLTGARTLSRQRLLRQLNVARLMTVIRLTLEWEMSWAVFEPNNRELWAEVRRSVSDYLDRLHRAGALAGATPAESFFVQCDETTMTRTDLDNGRLVALVGVAPSEPIEYIVLRLALDGVATVQLEAGGV